MGWDAVVVAVRCRPFNLAGRGRARAGGSETVPPFGGRLRGRYRLKKSENLEKSKNLKILKIFENFAILDPIFFRLRRYFEKI